MALPPGHPVISLELAENLLGRPVSGEGLGPNLRVRVDCPVGAEEHASDRNTESGLKAQRERWGLQGCRRGRTGEPQRVWSSPSQTHWGPFEVHLSSQSLRFSCFPGTMASVLPPS